MGHTEPACQCRKPRCHSSNALSIAVQHLGRAIQGRRQHGDLLPRAFQITPLDRLVHARNDHCGIAGVLAGSINGVLETRGGWASPQEPAERVQRRAAPDSVGSASAGVFSASPDLGAGLLEMIGGIMRRQEFGRFSPNLPRAFFLRRSDISADLFAVFFVVVGQDVGVGHAHRLRSPKTRAISCS